MPKRKANWWPPSILADPDVLSVDDEGRFVLCKICHVHYAVHGGKKPKPVIMNSNFRTRAWDVHKERTNSHRLQKQQERLQQAKAQQVQGQQTTDTPAQQQQQQQQQHQQQVQQGKSARPQHPAEGHPHMNQVRRQQQMQSQRQTMPGQLQPLQTSQTRGQNQSLPALSSHTQTRTQAPPHQVQGQTPASAPLTRPQTQHLSPPRATQHTQSEAQLLHKQLLPQEQRRQLPQQDLEEIKDAGHESLQTAVGSRAIERPVSTALEPTSTTPVMSARTSNTCESTAMVSGAAGKRPAPAMLADAPAQRRRVFRAGSPGSSMQLLAESEAARHATAHTNERHSFVVAGSGNHAKKAAPIDHSTTINQQADSSARWRHMHDDVSRALNAAPRRRQQGPASYTSGELHAAKTLVQTETGDLGSNNSERVAKKLRSLNAEYHASNMRHADAYNMRRADVFDRRSAGYKEYWGTLRDVYTTSGTTSGSGGSNILANSVSCRKLHHRSAQLSAKSTHGESKETEADSTTPDDSGSSEEAFRPAVVVHDASLISAIERLTDATSKQIAILHEKQASDTRDALVGLTSVMTDLRVQHGNAFQRMIELQEKHLKVMESILEIKLRKEAARNAKSSFCSSGSTTASSSGSSPDTTSNGSSGVSSHDAESGQSG